MYSEIPKNCVGVLMHLYWTIQELISSIILLVEVQLAGNFTIVVQWHLNSATAIYGTLKAFHYSSQNEDEASQHNADNYLVSYVQ